ncbi:GNAT family N-acetyltransferase [Aureimonas leprariae]
MSMAADIGTLPAPAAGKTGRAASRVLGRLGTLEVRLARSATEVRAAQELRYRVFFEEMSAKASRRQQASRRDSDSFDRFCDHLLVVETASGTDAIVGTYRLMLPEGAARAGGYYTAGEFRIEELLKRHPDKRFLELGRSCVLKEYRSKRTVELLWQGIWAYVLEHRVDVLFGCASLEGDDPALLAAPLALLGSAAPAPAEWRVGALEGRAVPLPANAVPADAKRALGLLPPLLKGYLRIGGVIGPEAVVDRQFGTVDVLVVLPVDNINARYVTYYGSDAGRRFVA